MNKLKQWIRGSGWIILLLVFDICYYYFIQYLIEGRGETGQVSFRFQPVFFLFCISVLSILAVRLSRRLISKAHLDGLFFKYILVIFISFIGFLSVALGLQYLIEGLLNQNRPLEYYLNNAILLGFLHMIVGNTAAGVLYFRESARLQLLISEQQKQQAQKELQVLKQQMSPHFLFNNLNTLNALIGQDPETARAFTRSLSAVYRYATQVLKEELVTLKQELEFAKEYFKLMQIRFGEIYQLSIALPDQDREQWWTVPLAMQIVIENVIKHNAASSKNPLSISIHIIDDYLLITNELRPKYSSKDGLGVGLENLNEQVRLVTERSIILDQTEIAFTTKIPLIKHVDHENTHH